MTRTRFCRDCGKEFEAVDDHDRLCKTCLLKLCRALVAAMDETIRKINKGTE
jgi:hypothetical protein